MLICLNGDCSINLEGRWCGRRSINDEWNCRCIHRIRPKHLSLMVSIGELIMFKRNGDNNDVPEDSANKTHRKKTRRSK
jgi:hypothetical protein